MGNQGANYDPSKLIFQLNVFCRYVKQSSFQTLLEQHLNDTDQRYTILCLTQTATYQALRWLGFVYVWLLPLVSMEYPKQSTIEWNLYVKRCTNKMKMTKSLELFYMYIYYEHRKHTMHEYHTVSVKWIIYLKQKYCPSIK